MDLSRRRKVSSHVETSSMNDIMFFLMLFFLIVSTMVNPNVIKLMLPNARSGKQAMKQPITVSVDAAGKYFIDRQNITPDQLEPELARRYHAVRDLTDVLAAPLAPDVVHAVVLVAGAYQRQAVRA